MAYPISGAPYGGAGTNPNPAYSGTFIPEIWSGKLIQKFYAATVLAAIANTDYEGEIKNQGDTVHIRTKPTITIRDYDANSQIQVERPSSSIVDLVIDQGKYFATILDDVMEVQSDLNQLSMWSDDAAQQMKITIDTDVLAIVPAGASAYNSGATAGRLSGNINLGVTATPLVVNKSGVLQTLIQAGQVLDEQNIPEVGRWVVIPPWMASSIKLSELRDASLTGDGVSSLRNGRLGMIDRFTLYSSNLLPTGAAGNGGTYTNVIAGHPHGLTFASQVTRAETMRSEFTFGTILRGLQVYGRKVIDGTAIVSIVVKPDTNP